MCVPLWPETSPKMFIQTSFQFKNKLGAGSVRGTRTVFAQQMLVDDLRNAFNAEFQRFENFFAVVPASLWILEFGFQKFEKAFKLDASELEH